MAHFIAAGLLAALANWVGLIPWRKAANAHWTERARLLWPVRVSAGMNVIIIPVILYELHFALWPDARHWWILDGLGAFLGGLLGSYPFDREIFPQLNFRNWQNQVVAGWGIRFGIWVAFAAAIALMPETFGPKMLAVAGIYLALHFAIQFGLLLKYLRLVKFMKPAGPRLRQIVDEVASRANVKVCAIWQLGGVSANAFAFPTTGELAFSDRLLEICDDAEVAAICMHELAHLAESKIVLAGRLLGSLWLFPLVFLIPCIHWLDGPHGIIIPCLGTVLISQFSRRLSQRMEKRADQQALNSQANEGVYARALEKIYRENQVPAVSVNNRQTHPHLYDRMLAAGISPEYPRPAKPERMTVFGWVYWFAFVFGSVLRFTHGF